MLSSYTSRTLLICLLGMGAPFTASVVAQIGGTIYRGGVAGGDDSELVSAATLPAVLLSFGGRAMGEEVEIRWETDHESAIQRFVVEYAADGVEFVPVGHQLPLGGRASYSLRLPRPGGPGAYYRLRVDELDATTWYSDVEYLTFPVETWSFSLHNPATEGKPVLLPSGLAAGEGFTVSIADARGRTVHAGYYRNAGDGEVIELPLRLQPASYFVTMARKDGDRLSRQLVVSR